MSHIIVRHGLLDRLKEAPGIRTDEAMARAVGVSESTYARVKCGQEPSAMFMRGLCSAFGLGDGEAFALVPDVETEAIATDNKNRLGGDMECASTDHAIWRFDLESELDSAQRTLGAASYVWGDAKGHRKLMLNHLQLAVAIVGYPEDIESRAYHQGHRRRDYPRQDHRDRQTTTVQRRR